MRLFDTTLPDDDSRRLSLSLGVGELAALYMLAEAAEDAGLDECSIAQDLRVAILRLEGNLTREIDRILPAIDALRVTGAAPEPARVERLSAAAAGARGGEPVLRHAAWVAENERLNDVMAI